MIRCVKCGFVSEYLGSCCPKCKEKYRLTDEELKTVESETEAALARRDFARAAEGLRLLADFGNLSAIAKYASMLERGELVKRDLALSAYYYLLGAKRNDPHCALEYSRLMRRENARVSLFWLSFAATLGYTDAYLPLAEALSERGREEEALYYLTLAEESGSKEAAAALAKRYSAGIGCTESQTIAKWYIDKFTVPPISVVKLAYRLRRTEPEAPEALSHPDYSGFVRSLIKTAEELGMDAAYCRLTELLSEMGEVDMQVLFALCLADGVGTERDGERAIALLGDAAERGSAAAYRQLGNIYREGRVTESNPTLALDCFLSAAESGDAECYEIMGEIYLRSGLVQRNIPEAIRLFDLAAREGVTSAAEKSEELKSKRRELFESAERSSEAEEAFRLYCISAGMGYVPAYKELATAFLLGRGTKRDRRRAYIWFKRAKDEGDLDALYPLALCYSRGIGTAFDFDAARATLISAASRGVGEAKEELIRILENKKRRLARKTYSKAMGLVYKKKFAEAKEALEACVILEHAKGIYTLGCLCEFGLGIDADRERAFALYEKAFALRFRDPRATYKLSVLKMSREALR